MIPFIENDSRLDDRVKRISAARRLLAGEGLLRVTHDVTRSDLAVATTQLIGVTATASVNRNVTELVLPTTRTLHNVKNYNFCKVFCTIFTFYYHL